MRYGRIYADLMARTDLSSTAKLVAAAINMHDGAGRGCFASTATLAADVGKSRRQVCDALSELVRLGAATMQSRRGRSTIYRLTTCAETRTAPARKTAQVRNRAPARNTATTCAENRTHNNQVRTNSSESEKNNGHQQAKGRWLDLYSRRYSSKHGWGAKQGKQLNGLLDAHGVTEVIARMELVMSKPPAWLEADGQRIDLGRFVAVFDKFGGKCVTVEDPELEAKLRAGGVTW